MNLTKTYIDDLSSKIIGAAIEVHKTLGPGLLEKIYEECLMYELKLRGFKVESQQEVPIIYKGKRMSTTYRYDLLVEDCIVVELKAVEKMNPVYKAQILSHINLLKKPKGILINFNSTNIFYKGQTTIVNQHYKALPQ